MIIRLSGDKNGYPPKRSEGTYTASCSETAKEFDDISRSPYRKLWNYNNKKLLTTSEPPPENNGKKNLKSPQ